MHLTFQKNPRELSKAGQHFFFPIPEKIKKWPKNCCCLDAPDQTNSLCADEKDSCYTALNK